jgi:hypothetical protein
VYFLISAYCDSFQEQNSLTSDIAEIDMVVNSFNNSVLVVKKSLLFFRQNTSYVFPYTIRDTTIFLNMHMSMSTYPFSEATEDEIKQQYKRFIPYASLISSGILNEPDGVNYEAEILLQNLLQASDDIAGTINSMKGSIGTPGNDYSALDTYFQTVNGEMSDYMYTDITNLIDTYKGSFFFTQKELISFPQGNVLMANGINLVNINNTPNENHNEDRNALWHEVIDTISETENMPEELKIAIILGNFVKFLNTLVNELCDYTADLHDKWQQLNSEIELLERTVMSDDFDINNMTIFLPETMKNNVKPYFDKSAILWKNTITMSKLFYKDTETISSPLISDISRLS